MRCGRKYISALFSILTVYDTNSAKQNKIPQKKEQTNSTTKKLKKTQTKPQPPPKPKNPLNKQKIQATNQNPTKTNQPIKQHTQTPRSIYVLIHLRLS